MEEKEPGEKETKIGKRGWGRVFVGVLHLPGEKDHSNV